MRKLLIYLLPFFLVLGSCSMEKRLYNTGWYTEHTRKSAHSENNITPEQITSDYTAAQPKSITVDSVTATTSVVNEPISKDSIIHKQNPFESIREKMEDDPEKKKKRMSYADAMVAMSKAGCTPNKAATTIYWLSIISYFSCWLGVGIILALVTLVISIFAINKVAADGNCVEENIAIIKAGRRNCWILLITAMILTLLIIAVIISIVNWGNSIQ